MARKITELTAAGTVLGTDLLWLEQTGDVPRKLTIANLESALGSLGGLQPIKQAFANFQPDGTTWRRVATSVGSGAGRGAAIIHLSNDGGSGAPGVYKFRVSKSWQSDGSDLQIQVLSAMGGNAGTINNARLCQNTSTGAVHFEVMITAQGASVNWYVEVVPELTNAFDVWSAVAFTAGAPENVTRTQEFNTADPYFGVYSPATNDTAYFTVTSAGSNAQGGGTIPVLGTLTQDDNYAFLNRTSANPSMYVVNASTGEAIRAGVGTVGSTTFSEYVNIGRAGNHIEMVATAPKLKWNETDAPADEKIWDIVPVAGNLRFRMVNDADASTTDVWAIDRAGYTSCVWTVAATTETTFGGTVDTRYGINGGYSTVSAAATYGGTIWALDTAFDGGIAGDNNVDTGLYGIKWKRGSHSLANSQVGEGLYLHINGTFYGGFGTGGARFGNIYPGQQTVGFLKAVSGDYGSVECDGADGSSGTWEGFNVAGRAVFMAHPTEQRFGAYDDVDNQWAYQWNAENAASLEKLSLYCGANIVAARTQDCDAAGVSSGMSLRHPNAVYYDAGFQQMPRTITNASATLGNEDAGGCFYTNNSTVYTITLNNQTDFPVEACFFILNYGSGNTTISQGTGSLLWPNGSANSGNRTVGPYSVATIFHYSAGTWFIWGDSIS